MLSSTLFRFCLNFYFINSFSVISFPIFKLNSFYFEVSSKQSSITMSLRVFLNSYLLVWVFLN